MAALQHGSPQGEGACAVSVMNTESSSTHLLDGCNAEVGEGPPKLDWGVVGAYEAGGGTDADVDAEEGSSITFICASPRTAPSAAMSRPRASYLL
jgi:hypothetical protein